MHRSKYVLCIFAHECVNIWSVCYVCAAPTCMTETALGSESRLVWVLDESTSYLAFKWWTVLWSKMNYSRSLRQICHQSQLCKVVVRKTEAHGSMKFNGNRTRARGACQLIACSAPRCCLGDHPATSRRGSWWGEAAGVSRTWTSASVLADRCRVSPHTLEGLFQFRPVLKNGGFDFFFPPKLQMLNAVVKI